MRVHLVKFLPIMSHSLSPTFYRLGRWFCWQTVGRYCELSVQGLEHLPARGPAII